MKQFIQNHPGEKDAKLKHNPQDGNVSVLEWVFLVLVCVPVVNG